LSPTLPPAAAEPDDGASEPSPPRTPQTKSEGVKLIAGLVVVCVGLFALIVIALSAIVAVRKDSSQVVALATAAFGVIGAIVGAYFGLKIGSDGTQTAISGMRDEASKAQAFAAHVPIADAEAAIASAAGLAPGSPDPVQVAPGGPKPAGPAPNSEPGGPAPSTNG